MSLYYFSKLTGAHLFALQGASFEQAGQPVKVSNAEGGQMSPAKGAMNFLSFSVAPHSQNPVGSSLVRRFSKLRKFISFNNRKLA